MALGIFLLHFSGATGLAAYVTMVPRGIQTEQSKQKGRKIWARNIPSFSYTQTRASCLLCVPSVQERTKEKGGRTRLDATQGWGRAKIVHFIAQK